MKGYYFSYLINYNHVKVLGYKDTPKHWMMWILKCSPFFSVVEKYIESWIPASLIYDLKKSLDKDLIIAETISNPDYIIRNYDQAEWFLDTLYGTFRDNEILLESINGNLGYHEENLIIIWRLNVLFY